MTRAALVAGILSTCLLGSTVVGGDGSVSYDLVLESDDFPDLDQNQVIVGDEGDEFLFTVDMVLSSSDLPRGGPQGWSACVIG